VVAAGRRVAVRPEGPLAEVRDDGDDEFAGSWYSSCPRRSSATASGRTRGVPPMGSVASSAIVISGTSVRGGVAPVPQYRGSF
jgi:hypothetical protein